MKYLKRFAISAALTALAFTLLHLSDPPKTDHEIYWITAAVAAACLFYSLIWDS